MARGSAAGWSVVAATMLAALALVTPAPSLADTFLGEENGLAYIRDSAAISVGGLATVVAECPPGAKAVGGGADSVEPTVGGLLNVATFTDGGDGNTRADDAFVVEAQNTTAFAGNTVAWVVCSPPGARYVGFLKKLRFASTRAVKATCPPAMHVTGGGGGVLAQGAQLKASRPFDSGDAGRKPDDGWLVRARNISPQKQQMFGSAACVSEFTPSYFSELTGLDGGATAGAGAPCTDSALSLTGAGGEIRGPGSTVRLSALRLEDNTIEAGTVPDDSVLTEGQNFGVDEARYGPAGVCGTLLP